MTEEQLQAIEAEYDALQYAAEVWTTEDLARVDELAAILTAYDRW